MLYLIVVRPFASYQIGDLIKGDETVASVLGSEHATHVVPIHPPVEE